MATDYERLKKEGYTEEEIQMILSDPMAQVTLSDAPMAPGREDKSAVISDASGNSMKTSNVMMGYNKKGLKLPSGDYVSAEELESAMTGFLVEDSENKTIVCRSTGEIVDVSTLTQTVIAQLIESGGLVVSGTSDKITNQTAYTYGIMGDDKKTRVFMAGNKGLQLPNGDYVSTEELEQAMSDYVYMSKDPVVVPPIPPVPPTGGDKPGNDEEEKDPPVKPPVGPTGGTDPKGDTPEDVLPPEEPEKEEEEENERHVVTGRRKCPNWRAIAAGVGVALILIASSLGIDKIFTESQIQKQVQDAGYSISQTHQEPRYEDMSEMVERIFSPYITGEDVHVGEGIRYDHESDKVTDKHGTFGQGIRQEGDYELQYISILDENNNIIKVEFKEGQNVADVIEQTLQEKGLSYSDIQVRVHIGGPVSGWIDLEDIIEADELTPQVVEDILVVDETYTGTQEDFEGTISISTPSGDVDISVTNPDGSLVSDGTLVTGSDGKTYQVDGLEVTDKTIDYTSITTSEKVTHSWQHLIDHAGFAAIASALYVGGIAAVGALIDKKKKEEEKEKEKQAEEEFASASYPSTFDSTVSRLAQMPTKTVEDVNTDSNTDVNTDTDTMGGPRR